jgi:hypothetical protein
MANINYLHDYIAQTTGVIITKDAAADGNAPVNMKYLLATIDVLNNMSVGSTPTNYQTNILATQNAVPIETIWAAVKSLHNCNSSIFKKLDTININTGVGSSECVNTCIIPPESGGPSKDLCTFTIFLDDQGDIDPGSGSIKLVYGSEWRNISDEVMTKLERSREKIGYQFGGFWTGINCTGTKIINNDNSLITTLDALTSYNKNGTAYACWIDLPDTVNITIDAAGGKHNGTTYLSLLPGVGFVNATMQPVTEISPITRVVSASLAYVFGGVFTEPNCHGTQIINRNNQIIAMPNVNTDTTIYACWSANVYLDPDGGTPATGSMMLLPGVGWFTSAGAPATGYSVARTKAGYTFGGFYTEKNCAGIMIANTNQQMITTPDALSACDSDGNAYACWL